MAYIGNQPADKYSTLSKQTITGDGTTGPYTLDYSAATAQDIEVFVNNVRQEPGVAYTVSDTALTMTGAVASTDDFYVVFQGRAVQTTTHPAGQTLQALNAQLTGDLKLETSSGGIYTVTGTDTSTDRTLTLPDEAGTVLTSASSISASQLPSSSIIQCKTTTLTSTTSVTGSTSSTVWYDVSGLSVTLTPTSASNTILIFVHLGAVSHSAGTSETYFLKIEVGGSDKLLGDSAGNRTRVSSAEVSAQASRPTNMSFHGAFTAGTTSSQTYQLQASSNNNGGTFYINRTSDDTNAFYRPRAISSMTVMEIAA